MSSHKGNTAGLPVIHERAAGVDVGSRFHVVAVGADLCTKPVQTFQAFTIDLERMADWLVAMGIKTVAMESTGVYWVPVYEVLVSRSVNNWHMFCIGFRYLHEWRYRHADGTSES